MTASDHEQRGQTGESASEAAVYIASLAEELAQLAKTHRLDVLAYLLTLARLEADQISKFGGGHPTDPSGTKIDDV